MDLFERMKEIFGEDISPFHMRIEMLGFEKIGIFGSGKVIFVSDTEITVSEKKEGVTVFGRNLKIARSENFELYIVGEIEKIERKQQ